MTIELELHDVAGFGPRVVLRGWDGPTTPARCKSISGVRAAFRDNGLEEVFDFWHYPLDLAVCQMLRGEFPNLAIGPKLWKWAGRERARRSAINDFHVGMSADPIELPICRVQAPTMYGAMAGRGFQTVPVAFGVAVGNYFNASQPGCGKTIETLASLVEAEVGPLILIVAPRKAMRATWEQQVAQWVAPDLDVDVHVVDDEEGTQAQREAYINSLGLSTPTAHRFRFVIVNPEMLRWEFLCPAGECKGKSKTCAHRKQHTKDALYPSLFAVTWDVAILDETHKTMMNANERSGSVSGWGYGAQKLKTNKRHALNKIGLSGTPFKGKPRRFWPVLHWLRPDKYTGQGKWTEQYFEMDADRYAYSGQKASDRMRDDRVKLFNDELNQVMVRHTKRELRKINEAWAPPEKVHVDVRLKMGPKQAKAYAAMVKDASVALEGGTLTATGILAEMTRLKQFASAYGALRGAAAFTPSLPSNKWDWIKEALEERGLERGVNDGDVKIIIASQYVSLLDVMSAELTRLGIGHFSITGKTKNTREIQDIWQSDQTHTRVMLLSTMAAGVSLTLDAADDVVLVDETFVPDDQEQVEDRAHRTSRTDHQVTIYHLVSVDTIDEVIADNNMAADYIQKGILDGRRGVEFARLVLAAAQ